MTDYGHSTILKAHPKLAQVSLKSCHHKSLCLTDKKTTLKGDITPTIDFENSVPCFTTLSCHVMNRYFKFHVDTFQLFEIIVSVFALTLLNV
jgi:hypothetical protein